MFWNGYSSIKKIRAPLIFILALLLIAPGNFGCSNHKNVNMPIVLLTDFGSEDYRIALLKGIILTNNIDARIIDATHSVPAFDIATGAYILDVAAREFPENVVFISIIAPYNQPEPIYFVLINDKNQFFILPDNGLLTYVVQDTGNRAIYKITNQQLFDRPMKELVAERIQGKVGALISSGYSPQNVGPQLTAFEMLDIQQPAISDSQLLGTVVYVDHFGNAVTNIPGKTADEFGLKSGDPVSITSPQGTINARFGTTYADVPVGKEIVFVINNLGVIQLSINLGNFADTYGVRAGAKIQIEK